AASWETNAQRQCQSALRGTHHCVTFTAGKRGILHCEIAFLHDAAATCRRVSHCGVPAPGTAIASPECTHSERRYSHGQESTVAAAADDLGARSPAGCARV